LKEATPDRPTAGPDADPDPGPVPAGYGGFAHRLAGALVHWLIVRRRAVLLAGLAAFLLGLVFTVRLYANLRSGFEELLPDTVPSVVAARTLGPLLHNVTHLSVVLTGEDGDALARLSDDLAARLRKLPGTLVESVDHRIDDQAAFLRRFGGLYLSVAELDEIQARLDRRIAWEKRRANPMLDLLGDEDDPAPALDFSDLEQRHGAATGMVARFRNGYFQTPDGKIAVLLVRPPESATGLEANRRVLDAVKGEVAALHPERYDPAVRVGYDGEVATLVEEQEALASDLLSSTVVVVVLVLVVLWVYFRRWTAILSILGALAVGCALTFGLSWFLVGYLNTNTAFLGSIVLGNGINVSIIVVARFLEERRRPRPLQAAIEEAFAGTLSATFVASFGAGLAYLSLAVTDFRGFSQFGVIGGVGMALCWLTAYLLLPALLATLDPRSARATGPGRQSLIGAFTSWLNRRHARVVLGVSAVLTLLSLAAVASYRGELIEYDLAKLRAAKSARSGAQYWGRKVDAVFQSYLTPVVVRAETPAELDRVVAQLSLERAALGAKDPLREVRTLATAIPADQEARLVRLRKLRETLTDARIARLDPGDREKALAFRPPADLRPITLADLPAAVRLPLSERDGTAGRVALAFPNYVGSLSADEMRAMTALLRGAIERSGARAQAVGQSLLFIDIADAIGRDGPSATWLAFLAVVVLVIVALRNLRASLLVLASLLLGVTWLVGIGAAARVRLNFLNFVTLPITFGIGVDYAVNVVQRWRTEGRGSLGRVLRETGGAVGLCSLTTIIGYGSLLVAQSRALQGFGALASLGEIACVTAALIALPAWLLRRSDRCT
jgi:predicted RND superfamily exporter protein